MKKAAAWLIVFAVFAAAMYGIIKWEAAHPRPTANDVCSGHGGVRAVSLSFSSNDIAVCRDGHSGEFAP